MFGDVFDIAVPDEIHRASVVVVVYDNQGEPVVNSNPSGLRNALQPLSENVSFCRFRMPCRNRRFIQQRKYAGGKYAGVHGCQFTRAVYAGAMHLENIRFQHLAEFFQERLAVRHFRPAASLPTGDEFFVVHVGSGLCGCLAFVCGIV